MWVTGTADRRQLDPALAVSAGSWWAGAVNHYEVLGVGRKATATEIRAAYRALSKVVHPDAGGDEYQFAVLEHSYRVLADPRTRAGHDRELAVADAAARAPSRARPGATPPSRHVPQSAPSGVEGYLSGCMAEVGSYLVLGALWLLVSGAVFVAFTATGNPSAAMRAGSIGTWLLLMGALGAGVMYRLRRR